MSDVVFIDDLQLYAVIGVNPWEREVRQKVRIDVEMDADCAPAGASDDLADAVDYRGVAKAIQAEVEGSSFGLVEALAEHLAAIILRDFPLVEAVRLSVAKPGAVRWAERVGVRIARRREP